MPTPCTSGWQSILQMETDDLVKITKRLNFCFFFNCLHLQACEEDWPVFEQLESRLDPGLHTQLLLTERAISLALQV